MMGNFREDTSASASNITILTTSNSSSTMSLFEEARSISPRRRSAPKEVENAIYGYIRAMRALGHTSIVSTDISDALNLPIRDVERAMRRLRSRGVRIIK